MFNLSAYKIPQNAIENKIPVKFKCIKLSTNIANSIIVLINANNDISIVIPSVLHSTKIADNIKNNPQNIFLTLFIIIFLFPIIFVLNFYNKI
ncbi:hypothetical protein D3C72_2123580 [compost metagenome]